MAYTIQQYNMDSQMNGEASLKNSIESAQQSQKLMQQATEDALWRMAQNNAMAKLKGMNKLAEAANQLS